jgi:hypothetical protein
MLLPNGGVTLLIANAANKSKKFGNQIFEPGETRSSLFTTVGEIRYLLSLEKESATILGTIPQEIIDLVNAEYPESPVTPPVTPPVPGGSGGSTINDSTTTSTTQTWSANKINTEIGKKSNSNHTHSGVYEPVFTKNSAFNKSFGTSAGTISEGNHTHSQYALTSSLDSIQQQLTSALNRISALEGNPVDTTPPDNVPSPINVTGLATTSLTLSWTASPSTDVFSYDVFNGTTKLGSTSSLTYSITQLNPNTDYTFWIKAKDAVGNTASGTSVAIKTLAAGNSVLWTYDFVVPQGTGSYNLKSVANFTHTLSDADVYGANLDGVNGKTKLLELGVQDGTPDEPGQELPRTGIDTFTAPSMHGGYQYDGTAEVIYFDSMAMNAYYFRIVKYA